MKKYIAPELEIVRYEAGDILNVSHDDVEKNMSDLNEVGTNSFPVN